MNLTIEGNGSVEAALQPSGASAAPCAQTSSPCTYSYGEEDEQILQFTLTASPDPHWNLAGWQGDCTADTENPLQAHVSVLSIQSCTASFALDELTVTTVSAPASGGSLHAPGGIDLNAVPYSTMLNLVATPNAGWDAALAADYPPMLSCGGQSVMSTDATQQPDGTLNFTIGPITADCTVTAYFANQAPRFEASLSEIPALVRGAPVSRPDWATNIQSGTGIDPDQSLAFQLELVGSTPPGTQLFAPNGHPHVDANGILSFTPGPHAGIAMFQARLVDDAGSAYGGSDTSDAVTFAIRIAKGSTDLSIHAEVPDTLNYPGDRVFFVLRVENAGPNDAQYAQVLWTPPPELSWVGWACEKSGGADCSTYGNEVIEDVILLPANGVLRYLIEASLPHPAPAEIINEAMLIPGLDQADPDPSDDSVEWVLRVDGLFRDGFEPPPTR